MGQLSYTTPQVDEALRHEIEPWVVSLYGPAPTTGIVLTGTTDNKVNIVVVPPTGVTPNGFDEYTTAQGPAVLFIGSGLGNGDSGVFRASIQTSIVATTGAATFSFKVKTRPYTETLFTNTTVIEGCFVSSKVANNSEAIYVITSPLFMLSDGDLIELAINPSSGVTIDINALAVTVKQEY